MICNGVLSTYWWVCPLIALGIILTMGIFCFLMMRKGWCNMSMGRHEAPMQCCFPSARDYLKEEKGGERSEGRRDQARD